MPEADQREAAMTPLLAAACNVAWPEAVGFIVAGLVAMFWMSIR